MKLLKVFLYHKPNEVFLHFVRIIVICVLNIMIMPCFICDVHYAPHEAVMVREIYIYLYEIACVHGVP